MSFISRIIMKLDAVVDNMAEVLGNTNILNVAFYVEDTLYTVIFKDEEVYYYILDNKEKKLLLRVDPVSFKPSLLEGYLDDLEDFYLPLEKNN